MKLLPQLLLLFNKNILLVLRYDSTVLCIFKYLNVNTAPISMFDLIVAHSNFAKGQFFLLFSQYIHEVS